MRLPIVSKAIFLCLILIGIPVVVFSASGVAEVVITDHDISQFPRIALYARVVDSAGLPVDDLQADEVTVQEGSVQINDIAVNDVDRGTYVTIVIDAGAGIDADGATFQSRLTEIKEVVETYAAGMEDNDYVEILLIRPPDQITVLQDFTNEKGSITDAVNRLDIESDEFLTFGLQGVNRALDDLLGANEPTGYKAILMLSSGIQDQGRQRLTLSEVYTKAFELGIPIHTILFKQTDQSDHDLDDLARETGGEYVHYSRAQVESATIDKIFSQGVVYEVSYRSTSSSQSRVITLTVLPGVNGPVYDDFRLELNPAPAGPEVAAISINNGDPLVRRPDERAGADTYWPIEVDVVFDVEWPDGYGDRIINDAQLVVDGELIGSPSPQISPGEPVAFKWDLRAFNRAGETEHNVQVHFFDELGYEVLSPDHNVALTVETGVCGQYQGTGQITCIMGSVVAPVLGAVSFVLIIAGVAYYYFKRDDFMARLGAVQTTAKQLYDEATDRIRGRRSAGQTAVAHLVVQRGIANMRKKYPLYPRITTIGRDSSKLKIEDGDIHVQDGAVSGLHANISIFGDEYTVTDMGSSNGTWLNGIELDAEEAQTLTDGDEIQIAESEPGDRLIVLQFSLSGDEGKEEKDQDSTTQIRRK